MLKLCDDIDTLSMMLCDGELADQELRDVELHLIDCDACRAHVEKDRGFLGELRQRMAPPRAPELVRQRLGRALDEVDRKARPTWRALALPGAATLAAAAALVVFAVSGDGPARPTAKPAAATEKAPLPTDRVTFRDGASIHDVVLQRTGTELLGADVANLSYWAVAPDGARYPVYATVHDAARLELDASTRVVLGGWETWTLPDVVIVRDGARAIRLSSPLGTDALKVLVRGTQLVSRIGADDPRR
jgi:hypothetical protein